MSYESSYTNARPTIGAILRASPTVPGKDRKSQRNDLVRTIRTISGESETMDDPPSGQIWTSRRGWRTRKVEKKAGDRTIISELTDHAKRSPYALPCPTMVRLHLMRRGKELYQLRTIRFIIFPLGRYSQQHYLHRQSATNMGCMSSADILTSSTDIDHRRSQQTSRIASSPQAQEYSSGQSLGAFSTWLSPYTYSLSLCVCGPFSTNSGGQIL